MGETSPEALSAMLNAFTKRVDIHHIFTGEIIFNENALIDGQPTLTGQFDVRTNARRDHKHITVKHRAILKCEAGDMSVSEHRTGTLL